jgi:hypothetical protein
MAEIEETTGAVEEELLPNLLAVHRWLIAAGYKIARGKLYRDAKRGLIRVQEGGGVRRVDAEAYVVRGGLKKAGGLDPAETDSLAAARYQAELEKIRAQTRAIELDQDIKRNKYVLKRDAIIARVNQLAVLEHAFQQLLHLRMLDWCYCLNGRPEKVAETLLAADQDLDRLMASLAKSGGFAIEYTDEMGNGEGDPAA